MNRFVHYDNAPAIAQVLPLPVQELMALTRPLQEEWLRRENELKTAQQFSASLNSQDPTLNAMFHDTVMKEFTPFIEKVAADPDLLKTREGHAGLARANAAIDYNRLQQLYGSKKNIEDWKHQLDAVVANGAPIDAATIMSLGYKKNQDGTIAPKSISDLVVENNGIINPITVTPYQDYYGIMDKYASEVEFDRIDEKGHYWEVRPEEKILESIALADQTLGAQLAGGKMYHALALGISPEIVVRAQAGDPKALSIMEEAFKPSHKQIAKTHAYRRDLGMNERSQAALQYAYAKKAAEDAAGAQQTQQRVPVWTDYVDQASAIQWEKVAQALNAKGFKVDATTMQEAANGNADVLAKIQAAIGPLSNYMGEGISWDKTARENMGIVPVKDSNGVTSGYVAESSSLGVDGKSYVAGDKPLTNIEIVGSTKGLSTNTAALPRPKHTVEWYNAHPDRKYDTKVTRGGGSYKIENPDYLLAQKFKEQITTDKKIGEGLAGTDIGEIISTQLASAIRASKPLLSVKEGKRVQTKQGGRVYKDMAVEYDKSMITKSAIDRTKEALANIGYNFDESTVEDMLKKYADRYKTKSGEVSYVPFQAWTDASYITTDIRGNTSFHKEGSIQPTRDPLSPAAINYYDELYQTNTNYDESQSSED